MANTDAPDYEVKFWLHMIKWWESNHHEPVPRRMHEALDMAKSKLHLIAPQTISERRQFH